jgi:ABC-type nitrate/sulfonate/bicarbonate transport system permease component
MKRCEAIETAKLIGIGIAKFVACAVAFVAAVAGLGYIIENYHINPWIGTIATWICFAAVTIMLALLILAWAHRQYEKAQVVCMMRDEREDRRKS